MTAEFYRALPEAARQIRQAVFVEEQGFQCEFDETDRTAVHLVLYENGAPVATGRLFWENPGEPVLTLGRIAVVRTARGRHLGEQVVQHLEEQAKKEGAARVQLSAQCQARAFYEKLGYEAAGEPYLDETCPHIHMEKELSR